MSRSSKSKGGGRGGSTSVKSSRTAGAAAVSTARPDNKTINLSKFFVLISTTNSWSASGMVDGSHLVSDFLVDHLTEKIYKSMNLDLYVPDDQAVHLLDPRFEYYTRMPISAASAASVATASSAPAGSGVADTKSSAAAAKPGTTTKPAPKQPKFEWVLTAVNPGVVCVIACLFAGCLHTGCLHFVVVCWCVCTTTTTTTIRRK